MVIRKNPRGLNLCLHLIACLFAYQAALGQSFSDNLTQIREIPTTPTMWEFEKYGNYPVSMHTGLPQIAIPIYNIKSGQIEMPISLSYHASGIKVDQKASWVGLGWSLMAGGAITRTIRGSQDEYSKGFINHAFYEQGTFDPGFGDNYLETEEMLQGFVDTEPDIFQYNFMGYSGRFVFEPGTGTGSPVVALIPHNDLKVEPVFANNDLASFTITTPEGYVAEFAYPEISSEHRPAGLIAAFTVTAKTAWHLKKITAPNGVDEVTFQYKTLGAYTDERYSESESVNFPPCAFDNPGAITPNISGNGIFFSSVKRLERIDFNNGHVLFDSTSGNRLDDGGDEDVRLDGIEIYARIDGSDMLVKKFDLEYGYFGSVNNANNVPNDREVRLKLVGVTESGGQGTGKNPYRFDYKETVNARTMPYRFSNSQDYWGYYNAISNPSLVPAFIYEYSNGAPQQLQLGDANRNVNGAHVYAAIGIIDKITYPTKGYTEFEFENNEVTVVEAGSPQQYLAGGVRIANIKSYHFNGALQWEKSYEYVQKQNPGLSSGVYNGLHFIGPRDYFSSRDSHFSTDGPVGSCGPNPLANYIDKNVRVSSTPILANNLGDVFYSQVKEYNGSPTNHQGYTWYHFDVTKDTFVQGTGPITFSVDRSWDRGQLVLEEAYVNGGGTPIRSVSYEYENITVRNAVKAYKPGTRHGVADLGYVPPADQTPSEWQTYRSNQYFLTYFEEPVVWKRLRSTTTSQDGVSTVETFFYDLELDHTNVATRETVTSDGETLEVKTYYPDDITSTSTLPEGGDLSTAEFNQIAKLKKNGQHRTATPIQVVTKREGQQIGIERNLFADFDGIVLPSKRLFGKHGGFNDTVLFRSYEQARPKAISREDGPSTNYIWGYENAYPILQISNINKIDLDAAIAGLNGNYNTLAEIRALADADNDRTRGTDGKEGDLRRALSELRAAIPSDAQMTSYTYDPLVGVTSITDPRGYTIFYEYDDLNRLRAIRDADGNLVQQHKYNYKDQSN